MFIDILSPTHLKRASAVSPSKKTFVISKKPRGVKTIGIILMKMQKGIKAIVIVVMKRSIVVMTKPIVVTTIGFVVMQM